MTYPEQSPRLRQSPAPGISGCRPLCISLGDAHRRCPFSRPQFPHSSKKGLVGADWVAGPSTSQGRTASRSCALEGAFYADQVG